MKPEIVSADPLVRFFKDTPLPAAAYTAHAARGETAVVQIVLRVPSDRKMRLANPVSLVCDGAKLEGTMRFVGFVPVRANTPDTPSDELEHAAPGLFPDPLLEEEAIEMAPGETGAVWLSVPVPLDQRPGTYRGVAVIMTAAGARQCPLTLVVHTAVIPAKRSLFVTNWFWPHILAAQYGIPQWSERHWEMIEEVARDLAAHRQNVIFTPILSLLLFSRQGGRLAVDFTRFDRWVALFDRYGVADRIEGAHLAGREGGRWDAERFVLYPISVTDRDTGATEKRADAYVGSEACRQFLAAFLPLLVRHLDEKGWRGRYLQHISDEPTVKNAANWKVCADMVKTYAPGIRIIDATMCREVAGMIDVWVPLLHQFDAAKEFYAERRRAGDEIWFYTCLIPRGRYPNRFIDYPLVKMRLLHWLNFRYGLTGYLHWGYNWWTQDPLGDVELAQSDGTRLPAGDNAIVYPGKRGVMASVRWEMMRKGIEDYEMLRSFFGNDVAAAERILSPGWSDGSIAHRSGGFFDMMRAPLLESPVRGR